MKWTHLPQAGGLNDQHPALLDDFFTIMSIEGKAERDKAARDAAKQRRTSSSLGSGRGRSRGKRR